MSATLRDIGATFSAITVTKCDMAHGRRYGLTTDRAESVEGEWIVAIGGKIARVCGYLSNV